MSSSNTCLTNPVGYDTANLIFADVKTESIPDSKLTYKRINISTRNKDGTVGELVIPTEKIFSFGVSENMSADGKKITGYSVPLCLYNKDGATEAEKAWVESYKKIITACKSHILSQKKAIGKFDLHEVHLDKLDGLYYKRDEDGNVMEKFGPTLYTKLIGTFKDKKGEKTDTFSIITKFYDDSDKELNPLDLINARCDGIFAVKIESIYIGTKITMQLKLFEAADLTLQSTGYKRLLMGRPKADTRVHIDVDVGGSSSTNPLAAPLSTAPLADDDEDDDDEDDGGSIEGAGDGETKMEAAELEPPKVAAAAPPAAKKRVVTKVQKK
jgi:hypothetical protein